MKVYSVHIERITTHEFTIEALSRGSAESIAEEMLDSDPNESMTSSEQLDCDVYEIEESD